MASRLAVMNDGRIVQVGTPHEVYERPRYALRRRLHRHRQHPADRRRPRAGWRCGRRRSRCRATPAGHRARRAGKIVDIAYEGDRSLYRVATDDGRVHAGRDRQRRARAEPCRAATRYGSAGPTTPGRCWMSSHLVGSRASWRAHDHEPAQDARCARTHEASRCASSSPCPTSGSASSSCCRSRWCWRSRSAPTRPTSRRRSSSASASQNFTLLFTDDLYLAAWLVLAAHRRDLDRWSRLLLGYPMAYAIARAAPRRRPLLLMLVILPFWTSFLIRVYAWMGLLAENGILNQFLRWTGLGRRSRHDPRHRMGGPSRHRLRLPAVHGAAALRHAGEARLPACSRPRPTSAPGRSPPSSPSPCRCRCPASSPAACWCSSRRSASS